MARNHSRRRVISMDAVRPAVPSPPSTTMRVRLNGGHVKVIFHRGLSMEDLFRLEARWPLARTLEDLLQIFRDEAKRTGQTCSILVEEGDLRGQVRPVAGQSLPVSRPGREAA